VAIAATAQMLVLVLSLRKKIGDIGLTEISKSLVKYMLAAGIMGVVIWLMAGLIDWRTADLMKRLLCLMLVILSGGAIYLISCYIIRVSEVRSFIGKLLKRR
jgi:putative peptidoglycan lipid II flippase